MKYSDGIVRLYEMSLYSKTMGLRAIKQLLEYLGNPERSFRSVHVAGTNGKGTVATKVASCISSHGVVCGLYTSPHISCFSERISIDGLLIAEEDLERLLQVIFSLIDRHAIEASFFEVTTALAFAYFKEKRVPWAVIEVRLGGRLDATNVVTPELAIITSISLDHTHILGNTIEKITREKAGILKAGVPVLLGPHVPASLIAPLAQDLQCSLEQLEGSFDNFEEENLQIATRAVEMLGFSSPACREALLALPSCRFERVGNKVKEDYPGLRECILDVGHNPDAIRRLTLRLKATFPNIPLHVVYGASSDKDIKGCLLEFLPHIEQVTFVEAANPRRTPSEMLLQIATSLKLPCRMKVASSIEQGVKQALLDAHTSRGVLVICGTFFIMAEARKALGFQEWQESLDLNEKIRQER
jgi:dihydrofolate synthase / folylpolyglutamate synthase